MRTTHADIYYWTTHGEAHDVLSALPYQYTNAARVVGYPRGWAVQLHRSGPYLGPGFRPTDHSCARCAGERITIKPL